MRVYEIKVDETELGRLFDDQEAQRLFGRRGLGAGSIIYNWDLYLGFCQFDTTVRATIYAPQKPSLASSWIMSPIASGVARCSAEDTFNLERGKKIALSRALADLAAEAKHEEARARGTKEQREKRKQEWHAWRAWLRSGPPLHYKKNTSFGY